VFGSKMEDFLISEANMKLDELEVEKQKNE
jgi:hypothetical protein